MSALDPAGPGAAQIAELWQVMLWGMIAITAITVALALYAALSRPERRIAASPRLLLYGGGIAFPGIVLTALYVWAIPAGHQLLTPLQPPDDPPYVVEVTGHQFWWEVTYPDVDGAALYDANEIHVPAGRPFEVRLTGADVIHSFWSPRLGGKIDAIPGITNSLRLEADAPGVYRGQCAEFCGAQHARMAFHVEAHEEQALQERLALVADGGPPQRAEPDHPGRAAFIAHCAMCHSADSRVGEPAVGPNLGGLAHRRHIAAGTIANHSDNVRAWIVANEAIKPGNLMPDFATMDADEVDAILDFLGLGDTERGG